MHHRPQQDLDELDLVQRLDVVAEELSVVDAELAAQQQEISELLGREASARQVVRSVVEAVPLPVVTTDAAGSVTGANQAAADLLGVPLGRLTRKPVQAYVAAAHRARARHLLTLALAGQGATGELDLVLRAGTVVHVHVTLTRSEADPRAGARGEGVSWIVSSVGNDPRRDALLHALTEVTHLPIAEGDRHDVLARLASSTTAAVPQVDWTSITIGSPQAPEDVAGDSVAAQTFDGAQWRAGEGPGVQAVEGGAVVGVLDLRVDARWPVLAALVAEQSVRSVVAFPLRIDAEVVGVLTVGSEEPSALRGEDLLAQVAVLAGAANAVVTSLTRVQELRTTAENLSHAMESRASIEQAKGLVAGWVGCTVDQAFELLAQLSQDRNVKLRDLATLLVRDPASSELRSLLQAVAARVQQRRS